MRAVTPGCRQLPHISNIFHVSSINIFWFIVFRESVGQGVGIGRVARWKLGLGWMAGAGVIWKLLDLHIPVACAGFGSAGTVDTNM